VGSHPQHPPPTGTPRGRAGRGRRCAGAAHLRPVGLLQFVLVKPDLGFVLAPQLLQGFGELALELPLPPVVDLHQPGLVAALGLPQLLGTGQGTRCHLGVGSARGWGHHTRGGGHVTPHLAINVLLEFELFLQRLQPVLGVHAAQHLVLQLLLGFAQGALQLRASEKHRPSGLRGTIQALDPALAGDPPPSRPLARRGPGGSLGQLGTALPPLTLATCALRSRTSDSRLLFSPRAVESAASLEFSKASTSLRRAWAVSRSPSFLAFLQGSG